MCILVCKKLIEVWFKRNKYITDKAKALPAEAESKAYAVPRRQSGAASAAKN